MLWDSIFSTIHKMLPYRLLFQVFSRNRPVTLQEILLYTPFALKPGIWNPAFQMERTIFLRRQRKTNHHWAEPELVHLAGAIRQQKCLPHILYGPYYQIKLPHEKVHWLQSLHVIHSVPVRERTTFCNSSGRSLLIVICFILREIRKNPLQHPS